MNVSKGRVKELWFPKKASVAFGVGAALVFDGTGYVTKADSTATKLLGISGKAVAATDSDYAANTLIPVLVPVEKYVIFGAAYTGTAPTVGLSYALSDEKTVNGSSTAHTVFTVTSVNSTQSTVEGFFNSTPDVANSA